MGNFRARNIPHMRMQSPHGPTALEVSGVVAHIFPFVLRLEKIIVCPSVILDE